MTDDKTSIINMRRRTTRMEHEGDYWMPAEKEELARAFNEGMGITEMATKFRRTEPAIMQQIENMDLYNRKENPTRRRFPRKASGCLCSKCPNYTDVCSNREHCPHMKEEI